jgi:hypothetical protein
MDFVRKSSLAAFFVMTLVFGFGVALAQQTGGTQDPGVQQRMENQEQRIDQGVTSGALTPKEAGRLEAEQARIKQAEERMKSDGNLTTKERGRLRTMQDRSSRHIYQQKHDAQSVPVKKP